MSATSPFTHESSGSPLLILMLLSSIGCGEGIGSSASSSQAKTAPAFLALGQTVSTAYNFGIARPGTKVDCIVPLRNTTDDTLLFVSADSSCSCTVADVTPTKLGPGSVARVHVTYHAPAGSANVAQSVTLLFREKKGQGHALASVKIKGVVRPTLALEPDAITFVTPHDQKDPTVRRVIVRNFSDQTWDRLILPESLPEAIRATVRPVTPENLGEGDESRQEPKQAWVISLQLDPTLLDPSGLDKTITVRPVIDDSGTQRIAGYLRLRAKKPRPVLVTPSLLFFGDVQSGNQKRATVLIRLPNAIPKDAELPSISHDLPKLMELKCERGSERSWLIIATLSPDETQASTTIHGTIVVSNVGIDGEQFRVPVYAHISAK